ncbi:MAG: exopolyphosphatase [Deltaproteobacteria bacterium]|nr:MAG: exopolyphosphatase [Deltaproteobacteria bacterium]
MTELMERPFGKSVTPKEKLRRLLETVVPEDSVAILINADPDAMASAMALKRLFWRKAWKVGIYHINPIQRADNLAFIRSIGIKLKHVRHLKSGDITRWAIVDSQPDHHEAFRGRSFDIIIDHHPALVTSRARFMDIREEYGANAAIMTEYLRTGGIRPASRLATALFYGIKTDTDNFVRDATTHDINAFRYLYRFTNVNIIKKIESSEITRETLESYRLSMERLRLIRDIAVIHMGAVESPDILVILADFYMKLAEATWSVASGTFGDKLVVIMRYAGFRKDAGKMAQRLFTQWGGSAGGHKGAARAEIPVAGLPPRARNPEGLGDFVLKTIGKLK